MTNAETDWNAVQYQGHSALSLCLSYSREPAIRFLWSKKEVNKTLKSVVDMLKSRPTLFPMIEELNKADPIAEITEITERLTQE